MPIEMIARMIGTKAATRAPKTTIRMTKAMPAPMPSPRAMSSSAIVLISSLRLASPTVSTSKPVAGACRWPSIERQEVRAVLDRVLEGADERDRDDRRPACRRRRARPPRSGSCAASS